jgi:hypothetical protein
MQQPNHSFANAPAYDADGRLVIKSTCSDCGAVQFVSVCDGSLRKWESRHECSNTLKITLRLQ